MGAVRESIARAVIPVADCPACGAHTLVYGAWDADAGGVVRRCTVCETPVGEGARGGAYALMATTEIEDVGFTVTGPLSAGGCGGGCSSGGCATCPSAKTCGKHH